MKQSLVIVICLLVSWCRATTYTAASVSYQDVSNTIYGNPIHDGDTVIVPAGSALWTNGLAITNDITFQGNGTNNTWIYDGVTPGGTYSTMINFTANTNGEARITGFTFAGTNTGAAQGFVGVVGIDGNCWEVRVDHCNFTNLYDDQLFFDGWDYGVVDHCSFIANFKIAVTANMGSYLNAQYGDGSWADDERLGSTNVICVEDCYIADTAGGGLAANALDSQEGGRWVFRHNICTNTSATTHGTETGLRFRGFRTGEFYQNTLLGNANPPSSGNFRGGTGLVYSNTFVSQWTGMFGLSYYRATQQFLPYWEVMAGQALLDSNNPTLFDSGIISNTNQGPYNLTDTTKTWTVNQYVNYSVYETNSQTGSVITSNSANTLFCLGDNGNGNGPKFTPTDHYKILQPIIGLDQIGRGKGDLLTGYPMPHDSVTGLTNWPNEALEPAYSMSNTINGTLMEFTSALPTIQLNRDFYTGQLPVGYTPLVYPHPLVNATSSPAITYKQAPFKIYVAPVITNAPPPDIAWWKGNTGSGTSDTASVGGINLTLSSASIWGTTFTPGGSTSDFVFNGTSYYCSSASAIAYNTNLITVEFRVYQSTYAASARQSWYESGSGYGADYIQIYNEADANNTVGRLVLADHNSTAAAYHFTRPSAGAWHHFAFVLSSVNNTAPLFYLDGVATTLTLESDGRSTSVNWHTDTIFIGANEGTGYFSPASMKDMRVFSGARSQSNIAIDATNYP